MGAAPMTGVILAGGRAMRFGGMAKGLQPVGGTRIIDRVAAALRTVTDDLLLVANDPEAPAWLPGVRVAGDVHQGTGALGGLHAALHHAAGPVLVVAWDMPFVPGGLLQRLAALGSAGADAALPWSAGPRGVEPLCAWYAPACLPATEAALAAGTWQATAFLGRVHAVTLPEADVRAFGDPAVLFTNVNTPDDLARLADGAR